MEVKINFFSHMFVLFLRTNIRFEVTVLNPEITIYSAIEIRFVICRIKQEEPRPTQDGGLAQGTQDLYWTYPTPYKRLAGLIDI